MENEVIKLEQTYKIQENAFANRDSFQTLYDIAKMFASSSLVPQVYQGKPQDCMIAVDMANRMNVSPMMVMQNLYVVKGKPAWSGQACMTLIGSSGKYRNVHPVYTGERDTDNRGCYIQATRIIDNSQVNGTEITIKMAKGEGWWSKKDKSGNETSKWQTMPEQMLAYRAASFFARVHCPESLMGVQTTDEVIDIERSKQSANDPFMEVKEDGA